MGAEVLLLLLHHVCFCAAVCCIHVVPEESREKEKKKERGKSMTLCLQTQVYPVEMFRVCRKPQSLTRTVADSEKCPGTQPSLLAPGLFLQLL